MDAELGDGFDRAVARGLACRNRRDFAAAIEAFRDACALRPGSLGARCELAFTCLQAGAIDEAWATYRAVNASDRGNVAALAGLGRICHLRGDSCAALEYFREAVTRDPGHAALGCELAALLRELSRVDEAVACYRRILQHDPAQSDALIGLAACARRAGDLAQATEYLRAAVAHAPQKPAPRLELSAILRELGQFDEAETQCRSVLALDPQSWPALVGLGLAARQRGEHADALEAFQLAAELQPNHAGIRGELAFTLRLLDRLDEAEALYRAAIAADPAAPAAYLGLSAIAAARGELDAAIGFAEAACARDKAGVDSRLALCALCRDVGRLTDAAALIETILAAAPGHGGTWMEAGQLHRAGNDRAAALAAFQQAAALRHERAPCEVAVELLALGRPEEARQTYAAVLAARPGTIAAIVGIAECHLLAADYEACIAVCDDAIVKLPRHAALYRLKCRALVQSDRADEALRVADGFVALRPEAVDAASLRLEILRTCGMRLEADAMLAQPPFVAAKTFAAWFEAALTRLSLFELEEASAMLADPPAVRPYERSRVAYAEGLLADLQWRIPDAIDAFERALALHAADPGAHHHLARLHLLRADSERAGHHLRLSLQQSASTLLLRGQSRNLSQNLLGQLLNELRLDRALAAELAGVAQQPPMQQAEALRGVVGKNPQSTPAALCLLRALRQAEAFGAREPADDDAPARIPRRIMQYWDEAAPPQGVARLLHGWLDSHPGYQYCRFDRASAIGYLLEHDPDEHLKAFLRASHPAQACDLFRLAYLFREGGFYIDADDRCVGHLSTLTDPRAELILYQEQYATLGNNFVGCAPGEPVIGRALQLVVQALLRGDADNIWLATGPGLLTRAFAAALVGQGDDWRRWLATRRTLDRVELALVSWSHSIQRYKNTPRGWLRSVFPARPSPQAPAARGKPLVEDTNIKQKGLC